MNRQALASALKGGGGVAASGGMNFSGYGAADISTLDQEAVKKLLGEDLKFGEDTLVEGSGDMASSTIRQDPVWLMSEQQRYEEFGKADPRYKAAVENWQKTADPVDDIIANNPGILGQINFRSIEGTSPDSAWFKDPNAYWSAQLGDDSRLSAEQKAVGAKWRGDMSPGAQSQRNDKSDDDFFSIVAPIALTLLTGPGGIFGAGGLAGTLGGGIVGNMAAGAIVGGASSALTGGDIGKGVLGGGVGGAVGGAVSNWSPFGGASTGFANKVAQGAVRGLATGAIRGDAQGGLIGGAISGGVGSMLPSTGNGLLDHAAKSVASGFLTGAVTGDRSAAVSAAAQSAGGSAGTKQFGVGTVGGDEVSVMNNRKRVADALKAY